MRFASVGANADARCYQYLAVYAANDTGLYDVATT